MAFTLLFLLRFDKIYKIFFCFSSFGLFEFGHSCCAIKALTSNFFQPNLQFNPGLNPVLSSIPANSDLCQFPLASRSLIDVTQFHPKFQSDTHQIHPCYFSVQFRYFLSADLHLFSLLHKRKRWKIKKVTDCLFYKTHRTTTFYTNFNHQLQTVLNSRLNLNLNMRSLLKYHL